MAKAESIETLLTPSLRVSRPVAACARCRSAKIKCDGKLPACSACERSGKAASCSSANDEFARGKERSYVGALEGAAARLQKRIDEIRATSMTKPQTNARCSSQQRPVSGGRRKEASDVDELVSDFGFLTVNATSRDFHGFTSSISFSKLLLSAATKSPLPQHEVGQLSPRQTITPLLQNYLENIYVLLPFFSETDFMSALSRVYHEASIALPVAPSDFWYVRLVLAISAASQSQQNGDPNHQLALHHVGAAMDFAEYVLHPGSMAGVQALLLLAQYALLDPEHFDSWYLIGMASRLVVDLGLHCEPNAEAKMSKSALDLRRRIFYCTYAMDRHVSMSVDLAFSFTDDSAPNVLLPTLATDLERQSPSQLFMRSLKPSLFLFDIRRVQSAFYQTSRWSSHARWSVSEAADYTNSVLKDVQAWHSSIPFTLSQKHLILFNLESLYSQLLVVAPNQRRHVSTMSEHHQGLVFEYSCRYAQQMQPLTQNISWHAFWTFADARRAQYIGRQFLCVMWANFDQLLRSQHIMSGISTSSTITPLDNCMRAIACLKNIADILDFASRRWRIMELRDKFEHDSAVLLGRLKNRQQEYSATCTANTDGGMPYPVMSQSLQAPVGQAPTQRWPDAAQSPPRPWQPYSHHVPIQRPGQQTYGSPPNSIVPQTYSLPPGSLPRRSYEFGGGYGSQP